MTDRVLVVIPTYNELESLPRIVARVRASVPAAELLVVDDASPDGTGALADELARADPAVHVLHRTGKAGLGAAYLAGFRWALDRNFDAIVEMDADGSHSPEQLPELLAELDSADLVLGSRWVVGGQVRNWSRGRELLSRGGNGYARWMLGAPIRDLTGGYRVFHRRLLEALPLAEVSSQGYCFQVDLAWQAWRLGFRVVEVPIVFVERELGVSKMSHRIVVEALWRVTCWGVATRRSKRAPQPSRPFADKARRT